MGKNISNSWMTIGNEIHHTFMSLYGIVRIVDEGDIFSFTLEVIDENQESLKLSFKNLEEVITFAEEEVAKAKTLTEVNDRYQEYNDIKVKKRVKI